jgi:hypothetical protein
LQITPSFGKIDIAKQACPKQTFKKLYSFQHVGGASPVLSKPEYPQCWHKEGFLPMSFWISCLAESFSCGKRLVLV